MSTRNIENVPKNQPLVLILQSEGMRTFLRLSMLLIIIGLTCQVKGMSKESSNENKWMCVVFSMILHQYSVFVIIILFIETTSGFYETAAEVRCRHNWGGELK